MRTLNYLAEWRPISARIHGLEKAATLHAGFLAGNSASPYGADKDLQRHCEQIRESVERFLGDFRGLLPKPCNDAIDRFLFDTGSQIVKNSAGDAKLVRSIVVKLVAFESEMTYCLDSPRERIRSASEMAFMHLQRLIVADEEYQNKWQKAFRV